MLLVPLRASQMPKRRVTSSNALESLHFPLHRSSVPTVSLSGATGPPVHLSPTFISRVIPMVPSGPTFCGDFLGNFGPSNNDRPDRHGSHEHRGERCIGSDFGIAKAHAIRSLNTSQRTRELRVHHFWMRRPPPPQTRLTIS